MNRETRRALRISQLATLYIRTKDWKKVKQKAMSYGVSKRTANEYIESVKNILLTRFS